MAQVARQRHAHAHRKYAGFFQRPAVEVGHVATGKNARVGDGLQVCVHPHAVRFIERQPGALQPGAAASLRNPEHSVGIHPCVLGAVGWVDLYPRSADLADPHPRVHLHAARLQHGGKAALHARVVGGQHRLGRGEQRKHRLRPGQTQGLTLGAQPVLHGQQQFHAARARAHHRNAARSLTCAHRAQQRQPALVKGRYRFDADRMNRCARRSAGLGRGAGVNGQQIVVQRRAIAQQHLAAHAVDADDFTTHKARPGKHAQAHQIQVHLVKAVVARHVARQHARVRRVRVGANQRDAQALDRLHGQGFEHADVAVAAAYQDQVAQYGGGWDLHGGDCAGCVLAIFVVVLLGLVCLPLAGCLPPPERKGGREDRRGKASRIGKKTKKVSPVATHETPAPKPATTLAHAPAARPQPHIYWPRQTWDRRAPCPK